MIAEQWTVVRVGGATIIVSQVEVKVTPAIADQAATILAALEREGQRIDTNVKPTPDALAELIERGHDRRSLASLFGKTPTTIDRWTREARAVVGDRIPPASRGPRADQSPD